MDLGGLADLESRAFEDHSWNWDGAADVRCAIDGLFCGDEATVGKLYAGRKHLADV